MEFKEAARIWNRMCNKAYSCNNCLIRDRCIMNKDFDPDHAEAILAEWAAEHPERTIADDFFEKHPKAPRQSHDYPEACARVVGYVSVCPATVNKCAGCDQCWQRPLEEGEG
jgi:hypothetical protein